MKSIPSVGLARCLGQRHMLWTLSVRMFQNHVLANRFGVHWCMPWPWLVVECTFVVDVVSSHIEVVAFSTA
jgi:hypothetical protein